MHWWRPVGATTVLTGRSTATGTFAGIGGERAWAFEQSKRVGRGELCPEPLLSGYARDASYRKSDVTPALSYMNFRKPPSHCPCTARDIESGEVLKSRSPARGPPRRERVRACEPLREEDRGGSEWRREEGGETDICILFREGRQGSRWGRPWSRRLPISTIAHLCSERSHSLRLVRSAFEPSRRSWRSCIAVEVKSKE